jgi:hypothetical protein
VLATTAVAAGASSGALAGALTGLAGQVAPLAVRAVVGTLLGLALTVAPLLAPHRLPQINRETEQSLLGKGPIKWALANGFLLGLGFTSRIGYWLWYLVPIGCFVIGSPAYGSAVWGTYGSVRLGIAALLAWKMRRQPSQMSDLSRTLLGLRPAMRRLVNPAAALFAAALTVWLGL